MHTANLGLLSLCRDHESNQFFIAYEEYLVRFLADLNATPPPSRVASYEVYSNLFDAVQNELEHLEQLKCNE